MCACCWSGLILLNITIGLILFRLGHDIPLSDDPTIFLVAPRLHAVVLTKLPSVALGL